MYSRCLQFFSVPSVHCSLISVHCSLISASNFAKLEWASQAGGRVTYISCFNWYSLACIHHYTLHTPYIVHNSCTVEDQVHICVLKLNSLFLDKSSRYGNSLFKLETIIIKLNEQINNEWIVRSRGGVTSGACRGVIFVALSHLLLAPHLSHLLLAPHQKP